ncbi:MAG: hypothetical protein ACR2PR_08870 [Pseudohongiellaceae bacterium]
MSDIRNIRLVDFLEMVQSLHLRRRADYDGTINGYRHDILRLAEQECKDSDVILPDDAMRLMCAIVHNQPCLAISHQIVESVTAPANDDDEPPEAA